MTQLDDQHDDLHLLKKCDFPTASLNNQSYCGWLRNPAPVENGGKHPIICRASNILLVVQDVATTHRIKSYFS